MIIIINFKNCFVETGYYFFIEQQISMISEEINYNLM